MGTIKVLVVDDSPVFREFLVRGLNTYPGIEVVGVAENPYEARDQIIRLKPDVMTCDIEMPRMNGIEFVQKLIPQYPIPVVMISSLSDKVFDALNAGAVDFVSKPLSLGREELDRFVKMELIPKVISANCAKVRTFATDNVKSGSSYVNKLKKEIVIAIGASTGGTEAIYEVIKAFGTNIPGIVVTQHIPPKFSAMFAERLNKQCTVRCKEAKTGDLVVPGQVLIAPGDKHMRLVKVGNLYQVECKEGERVNGHCPSVDVLFDSVARTAGADAIGIILTGMGCDGAKGLLNMRKAGAETIGQNKETCVVYGMPMEAYKLGAVKHQVALQDVAKKTELLLGRVR